MTSLVYAFPWNAPRKAISSPYLTWQEHYRRCSFIKALIQARSQLDRQPHCINLHVSRIADMLEQTQGPHRASLFIINFCKETLPDLNKIMQRYQARSLTNGVSRAVVGYHFDTPALRFMASRFVDIHARYNRMPDMTKADIDLLAADIANFIRSELTHIDVTECSELKTLFLWYQHAGLITLQFNIIPPHWDKANNRFVDHDDLAPAVTRMFSENWWRGRLRRIAAAWREHLQIALGNVCQKKSPYASVHCIADWREQKRRTQEFLKGMELEDEEGHRISLIEKYESSVANPAIRRCELMTRIRGFEDICQQLGYVGEFYTLTAPSKYHAVTKTGHRNSKWQGSSPSDTQAYFTRLWACIRAKFHREKIRVFGIRVAEPHHDGTPHWHMLMFMQPEVVQRAREIIGDYARLEDADELTSEKAGKARFHAQAINSDKGSATGYIAKYIAKNIDGYALENERDGESGELLQQVAPAVCAWAARWHIRQFQFIGGAPVTVYRELRRVTCNETAPALSVEFNCAHYAADIGDWAGYVNAQGGPFVRRDNLQVRTLYGSRDTFNQYGEEIISVLGLYDTTLGQHLPIVTRVKQWRIVVKRIPGEDFPLPDASSPPWSSGNNCTRPTIKTAKNVFHNEYLPQFFRAPDQINVKDLNFRFS